MLASSLIHPAAKSVHVAPPPVPAVASKYRQRTGDLLEDFLRDLGGDLVFCQGIRVRERVICHAQSALLAVDYDATKLHLYVMYAIGDEHGQQQEHGEHTNNSFVGHFGCV
jgi:hypothetical protein